MPRANEIKDEQTSYGQTIRSVKKDEGHWPALCRTHTSPLFALINSCWGTPLVP